MTTDRELTIKQYKILLRIPKIAIFIFIHFYGLLSSWSSKTWKTTVSAVLPYVCTGNYNV